MRVRMTQTIGRQWPFHTSLIGAWARRFSWISRVKAGVSRTPTRM